MTDSTMTNSLKRSFEDMQSESKLDENGDSETYKVALESVKDFDPRSYQRKVFEVAIQKNTIAVLDTGAGKTMIAVMLMQQIGLARDGKLIIFLAPTVHLVSQQFDVIKIHTNFKVDQYYGARGIDDWNAERWEKEISEHEVMVMTPMILLAALRKAFLNLDMICLLVFDECHRAIGNHPYARVMKEFYQKCTNKPKIFGMTASPVIKKGVSSTENCEDQMSSLEGIMDSKIYTVEDREELEVFVPSSKQVNIFYDPNMFVHEDLQIKLKSSWLKYNDSLVKLQNSLPGQFKDAHEKFEQLRKKLSNYHAKILCCLNDLGLICAYEAAKVCVETVRFLDTEMECDLYRESLVHCRHFLDEVILIIEGSLPQDSEKLFNLKSQHLEAVKMGYISPKLYELIQIFLSFGEVKQLLCLIFVDRIIIAKVIERFIRNVSYLSHFTVSYLTGGNTSVDALKPKVQKETLDAFRCGKINFLLTTDVAEEGLHVPNCSRVIRFDLPKTVRSYVQSRGRARQSDSKYILMLERGNANHRNLLFDVIRSANSMADAALNRDPDASISKLDCGDEAKAYHVESTGASITADSSVSLIYRYCEKLPGDKYFAPKPIFQYSLYGNSYECTLTLPPNAAFQRLTGPVNRNSHVSKQMACLEACKKLHQLGALDNHLLPFVEEPEENVVKSSKHYASGAGTTKRKELHGTTTVHALSGSWGEKNDDTILYAYKLDFACDQAGVFYSGFVLLIEAKLDDDVANAEVELFLVPNKLVKSTVSPYGQIHLDMEQVKKAKIFQQLFFNGLFGKLFVGSKSSGTKREFLFNTENKSLWSNSNLYLLLPLESAIPSHESLRINWTEINACTSVVEFLKTRDLVEKKHCSDGNLSATSLCSPSLLEEEFKSSDSFYLANGYVHRNALKNMVVLAIHTGKIYSVLDVVVDRSAESSFDGNTDSGSSDFTSFKEYFNKKYDIVLRHPEQPLFQLKQSHNPHNLLLAKSSYEGGPAPSGRKKKKGSSTMFVEKPLNVIHMPPELLVNVGVSISVLKSFYLFPSLMHRLESLMLANQLREEIACPCHIPSSLIMEALTTLRCCEQFSLERLELLGDSILKYAVTCYLFLKYPKKHEGQLSSRRSHAVCNATLHNLGTSCKLQGYIRDSAFDPRRWEAPGHRSPRPPVPCLCGVETSEVPLENKFVTEDTTIMVGKPCDNGHRWICSKTIADCLEALIGAYYVGGGLRGALHIMKWLGVHVEFEPSLIDDAINNASLWCCSQKLNEVEVLESKLGYIFSVKGLLLESITHASQQESGVGYCYQRLEFLGDAVLDVLITWYLFQSHTNIDPGELTDLRSASVNNESFAQVAVRHKLQQHLQHCSGLLLEQITAYAKSVTELPNNSDLTHGVKCPKALGDLVESIAGAILIDSKLNLDVVWRIFKPLLSPIVTPEKLELPPYRELIELCSHLGYFIKETCTTKEDMVRAELRVQTKDALLIHEGCDRSRKAAKGQAAVRLLKDLEGRGIANTRTSRQNQQESLNGSSRMDVDIEKLQRSNAEDQAEPTSNKKMKTAENSSPTKPSADRSISKICSDKVSDPRLNAPVTISISMKKGGPRSTLYELCKNLHWTMPTFDSEEHKSRSPMVFGEGTEKRTGFNSYKSTITLHIPNSSVIKLTGDERADKKSSMDSAALLMLHELGRQKKCIIADL